MAIANVFYPALIGLIKFVGTPLSGGKVLFYEPGTTTKRPIFLDAAMTSEAANPYTLDASGQAQLFTSGTYDIFVYTSADVLVYSWEGYNGININAVIDNTAIADILAGTAGFEAGNALKLGGILASLYSLKTGNGGGSFTTGALTSTEAEFNGVLTLSSSGAGNTNGDVIGDLTFLNYVNPSTVNARITVERGPGFYGEGSIIFHTSPNDTGPVERGRIDPSGNLLFPSIWANAGGTTAVMVSSTGQLYKMVSSLRYKKDVENIDPEYADRVMAVRGVWYRLKNPEGQEFENPSFYGFIAEEMAAVEPRLVSWTPQYKEIEVTIIDKVTADDGTVTETPRQVMKTVVDESLPLIPDGVDYQRITAVHHNKIQRQQVEINDLKSRIEALEALVMP